MPEDSETSVARVIQNPGEIDDLEDWGPVPDMIEGQSETAGTVLHKGPGGHPECGVWTCTPGYWECDVTRDEFCHFLEGKATYMHEDGTEIEVESGTAVFFPEGWSGTCRVHGTVRKVYMCP